MQEADIKAVVAQTLAEQKRLHEDDIDNVVVKTVVALLTSFGLDEDDRKELRLDFQHLRKWRKSVDQAQTLTFKVVLTAILTGLIGAVWLGFKMLAGKP